MSFASADLLHLYKKLPGSRPTDNGERLQTSRRIKMKMKKTDLESYSIDDLLSLRERIDTLVSARVEAEKLALESRLAKLKRLAGQMSSNGERPVSASKGRKVAAQFQNPDNPSQTWSGRGLRPRWMVAALNAGRTIEELLIPEVQHVAPTQRRKKGRS